MNWDILITGGIGLITTVVSSIISWFTAKDKYDAEVDHTVIDNMKEVLDFYKQLSDDNKIRLEESLKRCTALEAEVTTLNLEITTLRKQMLDLTINICMDMTCSKRTRNEFNTVRKKKESISKNN